MAALALLLLAAAIGFGLARALNSPAIPFLLVAGAALTAFGVTEAEGLSGILELGLAFLVFSAGIETSPHRAGPQLRAALAVGVLQFVLLGGIGYAAATLLELPPLTALYLALALAASSTLVVVRLVRMSRQVYEPVGRLVLGVLLLQDFLVVLALPLLDAAPGGPEAMVRALLGLAVLVSAAGGVRWALERIVARRFALDGDEGLLLVLAVLFAFGGAADALGLPVVTGAFLAGFSVSGRAASGEVRGHTAPLHDFFVALFFTALGASVGVPSLPVLRDALPLTLLIVGLTPPLVTLLVESLGFSARTGLAAGLLLAQTSEFSLVVVLHGAVRGAVSPELVSTVVLVTAMTMLLTPFLAADRVVWRLLHLHPSARRHRSATQASDHVVLLGCGSNGASVLDLLLLQGRSVLVVDDDPTIVARVAAAGIETVRGDATVPAVLDAARLEHAAAVVSTLRRVVDNEPALERARGTPVLVRGFSAEDAHWTLERGGTPVVYAEAAAEEFLRWFEEESGLAGGGAPDG